MKALAMSAKEVIDMICDDMCICWWNGLRHEEITRRLKR